MTLKSIEKYFARYTAPEVYPWVSEMLRDIQDEVDSSYMELPVDADGVPIRPGDKLIDMDGLVFEVEMVSQDDMQVFKDGSYDEFDNFEFFKHYNPRTLTDVLCDLFERRMTVTDAEHELCELLGGDVR